MPKTAWPPTNSQISGPGIWLYPGARGGKNRKKLTLTVHYEDTCATAVVVISDQRRLSRTPTKAATSNGM